MRRVLAVRQGPDLVLAIIGADTSLSLTHDEARALATMLDAVCDAEPYPPQIRPPAVEAWEDGPRPQNDFGRGAP